MHSALLELSQFRRCFSRITERDKMGKEGDLWDDSALINAFDDAMSKFKIMHGKKIPDSSTEGGKVISSTEENVSAPVNGSNEAIRSIQRAADENSNVASTITVESGEANNLAPVKENCCADSHAPEPYIDSSNGLPMQDVQDAPKGYSFSQGVEDYNQILSQYYELEEKRQKILQQLQQFSSWNYQCSGEGSSSGLQWGTCSTSQEYPVPVNLDSHPTVVCSCCPYVCQSLVAPCTSIAACSLVGTCGGNICTGTNAATVPGKSLSLVDGDVVKTAMGAAERAISSMKMKDSVNSDINEEIEKKKENEGEMAQSISSETDLTAVLNAWYSAGFYTGKYLVEQSIAKKRHS